MRVPIATLVLIILLMTEAFSEKHLAASSEKPFSAILSLSKTEVNLHESFEIHLTLSYPGNYEVDMTALRKNLFDSPKESSIYSLVKETIGPKSILNDGIATQEIVFQVEPWKPGDHFVTAFDIIFRTPNAALPVIVFSNIVPLKTALTTSQTEEWNLPSRLFSLESATKSKISPENESKLTNVEKLTFEIKRNQEILRERSFPWIWLFLLAGSFLAIWVLKGRLGMLMRTLILTEPPLNASEKALQSLKALHEQDLTSQGLFEGFYIALTDIVRFYIEEKFNIRASELTTEEFLKEAAQHSAFNAHTKQLLADFLGDADLVKFARHKATAEECDKAYQSAQHFITNNSSKSAFQLERVPS